MLTNSRRWQKKPILRIRLLALVLAFKTAVVFAFLDPSTGRWLNRDPLGDSASLVYLNPLSGQVANPSGDSGISPDDPWHAWTQVNLNLYGVVLNNPVGTVDLFGLDCYLINRQLFPGYLNHAPWPRSRYDFLSHTFVLVTHPDGSISTYSWGNTANPTGWNTPNQKEDVAAAQQALKMGGNYLNKVGDSSLDKYMGDAYKDLKQNEPAHGNGVVDNNCKSEATKLVNEAKQLQQPDQNQNQTSCNGN